MNRVLSIILGVALAGLFLFMLPYIVLAGVISIVILRLLFGRKRQRVKVNKQHITSSFGQRYQQAYAMHWQKMSPMEREDFLNRNAPENIE